MSVFDKMNGWVQSVRDNIKAGMPNSKAGTETFSSVPQNQDGVIEPIRKDPPKLNDYQQVQPQAVRPQAVRPQAVDPQARGSSFHPQQPMMDSQRQAVPQMASQFIPRNPQQPYPQPASQAMRQPMAQPGYPQSDYARQPMAQPMQQMQAQAQPMQQAPAQSHQSGFVPFSKRNVLDFPKQKDEQNAVNCHYIMLLRNREECKNVIAYIKTNASVFLNMECISGDAERQRCVDVLSGAAYTLGCTISKISPRGMYLISAPNVKVIMDESMKNQTNLPDAPDFIRQRRNPVYPQSEVQQSYAGYQQAANGMGIPVPMMAQQPVQPAMRRPQRRTGTPTERFASPVFQRPQEMMGSYPNISSAMPQAD